MHGHDGTRRQHGVRARRGERHGAQLHVGRGRAANVRAGGHVRFDCGRKPVTITLRATAKVLNTRREVVLDGGGRVTLSGGGQRRILYMDTCDPAQEFTTSHCQDQATPKLTVRDIACLRPLLGIVHLRPALSFTGGRVALLPLP